MRKIKRWVIWLTVLCCILGCLPAVSAATVQAGDFAARVAQLKQIYKHGEYFNGYGKHGFAASSTVPCPSCSRSGRYSCNNCSDRCGEFHYGDRQTSQCFGFVCTLMAAVFGGNPDTWQSHQNASALKVGDIIYGDLGPMFGKSRTLNHAVFVTALTDSTVTFVDCNWTGPCKIRWGKTVSRSTVAPSLRRGSVIYHAPNNAANQVCSVSITLPKQAYAEKESISLQYTAGKSPSMTLYVQKKNDFKYYKTLSLKNGKVTVGKLPEGKYLLQIADASGSRAREQFLVYRAADMNFRDVHNKDWFCQNGAVPYVYSKGLFMGVEEDRFAPEGTMQRAMFVTVLGRLAGAKVDHGKKTAFSDVPADMWYSGYVTWAVKSGITDGVNKQTFAPYAPITREQICKMMVAYAAATGQKLPEGVPLLFADRGSISEWAVPYVNTCSGAGLINGISENGVLYFRPNATATRAQVATIICNFVRLV